jgi:predicted Zn finger-like uncharacterized protein
MPNSQTPPFKCPNCAALYQVIRIEVGPPAGSREVTCRACGGPLLAREGKFVLKYFLLRRSGELRRYSVV